MILLFVLSLSTIACKVGSSEGVTSFTWYMESMMYGAMSHCTMLKAITMKGISSRLTPAKAIMNVKKSVDNPIMTAKVPIREKRSFHKLKKFILINAEQDRRLITILFLLLS